MARVCRPRQDLRRESNITGRTARHMAINPWSMATDEPSSSQTGQSTLDPATAEGSPSARTSSPSRHPRAAVAFRRPLFRAPPRTVTPLL